MRAAANKRCGFVVILLCRLAFLDCQHGCFGDFGACGGLFELGFG